MPVWVQDILWVLGLLAAGLGLVALGTWLLPKLRDEEQGYPLEDEIEDLLLPFIFRAICGAYKVSEWAQDEFQKRLDGLDKKLIADQVYALLPDEVGGYDVSVIKRLIPRERFEELVQQTFDSFSSWFDQNWSRFSDYYEDWVKDNELKRS